MRCFESLSPVLCLTLITLTPLPAPAQQAEDGNRDQLTRDGWTQSYKAGYTDSNGAYAGGSEIMHLVPHLGKLYAANGYWTDSHWANRPYVKRQSAQVLRLDAADSSWVVDLDLGRSNGQGFRYMKGNILRSITVTQDAQGEPLSRPKTLLVMAAGAYRGADGVVSAWVRDDAADQWHHSIVQQGSRSGGIRWIPRDMQVYRDKVTGRERLFLLIGDPGIISGVYDDSLPTKIRWAHEVAFPTDGTFNARPLGMVEANGSLLFSVGGTIYRRVGGPNPSYTKILDLGDDVNTDVGGIRGLTTIANPNGPGDSVLFMWAPNGRSSGQIKRLDPDLSGGYTVHDEANLRDLMQAKLGIEVAFTLGAHNRMYAAVHPATGEIMHLIGFQGNLRGGDSLRWGGSRLYAGALYAVRSADQTYTVHEVNGPYAPGKPALVVPRAFAISPFGEGSVFAGGHDASFHPSDDMAWVFKAPLDVVLGLDRK